MTVKSMLMMNTPSGVPYQIASCRRKRQAHMGSMRIPMNSRFGSCRPKGSPTRSSQARARGKDGVRSRTRFPESKIPCRILDRRRRDPRRYAIARSFAVQTSGKPLNLSIDVRQ